jgi:hypothetical protein
VEDPSRKAILAANSTQYRIFLIEMSIMYRDYVFCYPLYLMVSLNKCPKINDGKIESTYSLHRANVPISNILKGFR